MGLTRPLGQPKVSLIFALFDFFFLILTTTTTKKKSAEGGYAGKREGREKKRF